MLGPEGKSTFQSTREKGWVRRERKRRKKGALYEQERKIGSKESFVPGDNCLPFFQCMNKGLP
jgi:hypothetical protein